MATEKKERFNPFTATREKLRATKQQSSVIQEDITLGDKTVQNLLREQEDPLTLQEKLKALFSADTKTEDPFPINGEQLHNFLGVVTVYRSWIKRYIEYAGLIEGQDFNLIKSDRVQQEGNRTVTREIEEHMLTLNAAKEIAMLQKSDLGKLVRRYLIWAEKKLRESTTVQQVQQPTDILDIMGMAVQALKDIRDQQRKQQKQLDQVTEEQKLISDRVNSLEKANKIEKPPAVISKRCNVLNGLTTKLAQDGTMTYQQSKQACYNHVLTELNLDIDQELEKYKTACRRYYEMYKINKGTPPKDVLRPAAIDSLGWISWVSTDIRVYNSVMLFLNSYVEEG